MLSEPVAASASFVVAACVSLLACQLLTRWLDRRATIAVSIVVASLIGASVTVVTARVASVQLLAVVASSMAMFWLGFTRYGESPRAVLLAGTALGVVLVVVGVRLPVTHSALINALVTLALFAPLILMCTNIEGSPGGQVSITPVMVAGASIVGLIRGDHELAAWGLGVGGACIGVAGLVWLGRGVRLTPPTSLLLATAAIGVGVGFQGKVGLSVLAIGIGLLVIPVTELFVWFEGRRRSGHLYWGHGDDHLWFRLRAHGLSGRLAAAVMIGAAGFGVTCSILTAATVIPWPVGLVLAWSTKLSLTWWALRAPLDKPTVSANAA